jgi:hypothetical protein
MPTNYQDMSIETISYIVVYGGFAVLMVILYFADKSAREATKRSNREEYGHE